MIPPKNAIFIFILLSSCRLYAGEENTKYLDSLNIHWFNQVKRHQLTQDLPLRQLIEKNRKHNYPLGHAEALKIIGVYYYFKGELDSAQVFYQRALNIVQKKNKPLRAKLLMNMGAVFEETGRYAKAYQYLIESYAISHEVKDSALISAAANNLANVLSSLNRLKESIPYFDTAIAYSKAQSVFYCNALSSKATTFRSLGDSLAALEFFKEALSCLANFPEQERILANVSFNYANLLVVLKQYHLAREFYDKARFLFEKLQLKENQLSLTNAMANLEWYEGNYRKAFELYQLAYKEAGRLPDFRLTLLRNLEMVSVMLQDTIGAYKYIKMAYVLNDSLLGQGVQNRIDSIAHAFEIERIQNAAEIARLEMENDKMKLNKRLAWSVAGLVLLILSLFWFVYDSRIQKMALKRSLQDKKMAVMQALSDGETLERKRLSEELHDGLGSSIGALHLNLSKSGANDSHLQSLENLMQETRRIAQDIMPFSNYNIPLVQAIEKMVLRHSQNQLKITFHNHLSVQSTSVLMYDHQLYRIVQELIRNTEKHAKASEAHLSIWTEGLDWMLEYEDNGLGFELKTVSSGLGLMNIKNRIERLNGVYSIETQAGKGFRISIKLVIL